MKIYIILISIFYLSCRTKLQAQQNIDSTILLSNNCRWDSISKNRIKFLKNKKGWVFNRFGATIINIKGRAYNPCNLPPNLIGKTVLISGIIYKKVKADGKAIKLTAIKILSNN